MPTYAYRCTNCAHEFEAVQKFSDDPLTECPECGSPIRRIFQPVGIVFKGSGWYINDSRKSSDKGDVKPAAEVKTDTAKEKSDSTSTKSSTASEAAAPAKVAAD